MRAWRCCALALLVVAGCGRDGEEQSKEEGLALEVRDQSFGLLEESEALVLSLVDRSGACEAAQAVSLFPEARALSLLLRKSEGGPVEPGTFSVWFPGTGYPSGNLAFADFTRTDALCQNELTPVEAMAFAGTVELESFDGSPGGRARGSYELRFSGGALSGRFDAAFCELPANFVDATPVCR